MRSVFVDVNVIVDFLDVNRPRHQAAVSLFASFLRQSYEVCISEDMLSTIYYIMKDKEQTLTFFRSIVFTKWRVLAYGSEVYEEAAVKSMEKKIDFEDLLQCLCAKKNGCKLIVSNDHTFYNCGVEIVSAEEYNGSLFQDQ